MYLVFSRSSKELLSASDVPLYESSVNEVMFDIAYYDDYVVVQNREDIDFIEEHFDEVMGVTNIVPGQYELSDEVENYLKFKSVRERVMKEAVEKATEKVNEIYGFAPLAYSQFMVNGIGSLLHDILMTVQNNTREVEKELIQDGFTDEFEEKLKKSNIIDGNYKKLKKIINEADNESDNEGVLVALKYTLDNLI